MLAQRGEQRSEGSRALEGDGTFGEMLIGERQLEVGRLELSPPRPTHRLGQVGFGEEAKVGRIEETGRGDVPATKEELGPEIEVGDVRNADHEGG